MRGWPSYSVHDAVTPAAAVALPHPRAAEPALPQHVPLHEHRRVLAQVRERQLQTVPPRVTGPTVWRQADSSYLQPGAVCARTAPQLSPPATLIKGL